MKNCRLLAAIVILFSSLYSAAQGTLLLRQPSVSKSSIVFMYGDDLWVVAKEGGNARRLTTAIGTESSPRISPDGNWVAFSGQYDGNTDVYLVSIDGGDRTLPAMRFTQTESALGWWSTAIPTRWIAPSRCSAPSWTSFPLSTE